MRNIAGVFISLLLLSAQVQALTLPACNSQGVVSAGHRDQAKRLFQRLTGVPPLPEQLQQMAGALACSDPGFSRHAAAVALDDDHFYNITLKNWVTPWTNEEQTVFAALNDYTATVIGMIYNDDDFRELLYGDYLYTAPGIGLPDYSTGNNNHYAELENRGVSLKDHLVKTTQSYLPAGASAGIMTSRAAAKAFFIDGTNRAMLRFTLINHLCRDLEQVKDITRSPDRIRQDVSRSPGGDSRIFLNNCIGCHSGMDPLAQAFAYYHYSYDADSDPDAVNGQLVYTAGEVQPKYLINGNNFAHGFVTSNDHWSNYWREGINQYLNWSGDLPGEGAGAKSMGMELAHSEAFARCQVEKVFRTICLRKPVNAADKQQVQTLLSNFSGSYQYRLKPVFADTALYCMGDD